MGINLYPQQFPPPDTPLVDAQGRALVNGKYLWLALWNRSGQGNGSPTIAAGQAIVASAIFAITTDWVEFTTVAGGGIAQLPPASVGADCLVFNDAAANAASIIPPVGLQIDALGVNVGYPLAAQKMQWFRYVTMSLIKSMQLG